MPTTPTLPGSGATLGLQITKEDNNAPRLVIVVPWEVPGTWEQWRELLQPGPVVISSAEGAPVTYDAASRRLREPVRRRLLSPQHRRHLLPAQPVPLFLRDKDRRAPGSRPELEVLACDVLHVETIRPAIADQESPHDAPAQETTRLLLALHTVLHEPTATEAFSWVRGIMREPAGRRELERTVGDVVATCLPEPVDRNQVGHGYGATEADGSVAAAPYCMTYVPKDRALNPGAQCEGNTVPNQFPADVAPAQVSAWLWGELPRRGGKRFEDADAAELLGQVHQLSRTWTAYAGSYGCAFIQLAHDSFRPLLHMEGRFLEAVLLMLLQRYRAASLMERLAAVQPHCAEQVDQVIELDSQTVGFVVTEQWSTMTDNDPQLDGFLDYLLHTYRVALMVEEVRDQAHRLRENVLMRIGRAEQEAEEARARSSRVMEVALAVLTFVGMPLGIFMEVWANWEAAQGIGVRQHSMLGHPVAWGWWLLGGLGASVVLGLLAWWLVMRWARSRWGR